MSHAAEAERIRRVFETRYAVDPTDHAAPWHPRNPRAQYYRHRIERAVLAALNEAGVQLVDCDLLDVGCGSGAYLRWLVELGADPRRAHGVDLVEGRIADARRVSPHIDFQMADATALPFGDGSFDVVAQFTVLSSVVDPPARAAIAAEMRRVLRPGGTVLWFDIARQLPGAQYRAIPASELPELFPGYPVLAQVPVLHRFTGQLLNVSATLCAATEHLPLPRTNLVAVLGKPLERKPEDP